MRAKGHLSPWRELGYSPAPNPQIRQAQLYSYANSIIGVGSWVLLAIARATGIWNAAVPLYANWWTPVRSGLVIVGYAVAGWRLGRRDPRGALLALGLFAWSAAAPILTGHVLNLRVALALIGIVLIVRAAGPLHLISARPVG